MFKTLLAATAVAAFTLPAQAVTVVAWDFEALPSTLGVTGTTYSVPSSTGTGTATGMHASSATTFSSPAGNGSPRSLSANTWAIGDYWQFSLGTTGFTGVSVSFDQTGSNTGPRDFTLAYSTNGTTFTNFASYALINASWSAGTPVATSSYSYDLSAVTALNNASNVVFRLVDASATAITGGAVAGTGTSRVDNFVVMATAVPEPGTYALLLAGLGAVLFIARRRA